MPHRCMNCGETYDDEAEELIDGCECGSSLFIYEKGEEIAEEEKERVETEIKQMAAAGIEEKGDIKFEFDLDSITVEEEGVYRINISRLLKEIPLVIKKDEGKYYIQLPSAFNPEDAQLEAGELDR